MRARARDLANPLILQHACGLGQLPVACLLGVRIKYMRLQLLILVAAEAEGFIRPRNKGRVVRTASHARHESVCSPETQVRQVDAQRRSLDGNTVRLRTKARDSRALHTPDVQSSALGHSARVVVACSKRSDSFVEAFRVCNLYAFRSRLFGRNLVARSSPDVTKSRGNIVTPCIQRRSHATPFGRRRRSSSFVGTGSKPRGQ